MLSHPVISRWTRVQAGSHHMSKLAAAGRCQNTVASNRNEKAKGRIMTYPPMIMPERLWLRSQSPSTAVRVIVAIRMCGLGVEAAARAVEREREETAAERKGEEGAEHDGRREVEGDRPGRCQRDNRQA